VVDLWKGAKCLVTGGAGLIGSHLVKRLVKEGAIVTVVDNCSSGDERNLEEVIRSIRFIKADLKDKKVAFKVTRNQDYVFHLAANMGGIGYITKVGADIMRDNLLMNINMLEASVVNRVKRFFFSSSACVYPMGRQATPDAAPLKEDEAIPADPNEFYGWEKLVTERACEAYSRDYGLETRVARFHNIFGEAYNAFDPERGKAPGHLIRKAILYPKERFVVWGDGKQTRSFLYVEDCVEGILRLMESDYAGPVNIGSDRLITIEELAKIIIEISGKDIKVEYDPTKPQGVRGRSADLTLARRVLGWSPRIPLEEGLRRMYLWAKERYERGVLKL
jgi:nucleoside-diphosphate-sugar epimerase